MRLVGLAWAGFAMTAACSGAPTKSLQVQGTVRARGTLEPIAGAEVLVEWPRGGQTQLRTNRQGRYAVGRTARARDLSCVGLAISVQVDGYASSYLRQTEECRDSVLTVDFTLFQVPR